MENVVSSQTEVLDRVLQGIHDAVQGDIWAKRSAVAARCGYMDAKFMRYMHETYGLSVADQVVHLRRTKSALRIPWEGLRVQFEMMGMKPSAVVSMLNEAREFATA